MNQIDEQLRDFGQGTAIFSPDGRFRFELTRRWREDLPLCCFIGLNPSTATERVLDNTVRRCCIYARDWGFGSMLMLNLFAFRTPSPKEMFKAKRRGVDIIGAPENLLEALQARIARHAPALVVAAWGIDGGERGFLVLDKLRAIRQVHVLGWNQDRSPKHPLYLAKSLKPMLVV